MGLKPPELKIIKLDICSCNEVWYLMKKVKKQNKTKKIAKIHNKAKWDYWIIESNFRCTTIITISFNLPMPNLLSCTDTSIVIEGDSNLENGNTRCRCRPFRLLITIERDLSHLPPCVTHTSTPCFGTYYCLSMGVWSQSVFPTKKLKETFKRKEKATTKHELGFNTDDWHFYHLLSSQRSS